MLSLPDLIRQSRGGRQPWMLGSSPSMTKCIGPKTEAGQNLCAAVLARISHRPRGLRGAVVPTGQESRAARCGTSGKRLDAACRPDADRGEYEKYGLDHRVEPGDDNLTFVSATQPLLGAAVAALASAFTASGVSRISCKTRGSRRGSRHQERSPAKAHDMPSLCTTCLKTCNIWYIYGKGAKPQLQNEFEQNKQL